jgi:hypothetical protein
MLLISFKVHHFQFIFDMNQIYEILAISILSLDHDGYQNKIEITKK